MNSKGLESGKQRITLNYNGHNRGSYRANPPIAAKSGNAKPEGRLAWDSDRKGTYIKSFSGELKHSKK